MTADEVYRLSRVWVRYHADVHQVPRELVEAIIDEESAWNPYVVSKKGAVGLIG
jgi:soluble lytic murein transglycosylase-like protein